MLAGSETPRLQTGQVSGSVLKSFLQNDALGWKGMAKMAQTQSDRGQV